MTPKQVYRRFIEFEERAAGVYLRLAKGFSSKPQLSAFWLEMAMHEKQHAGLLCFCLTCNRLAPDLPGTSEVQKLNSVFKRLEKIAANPKITIEEAFAVAIAIETSEVDDIYCHLTTGLHDSAYLLRRKIAALPNHIEQLATAAEKFGVGDSAVRELHRLKKRVSARWRHKKAS